MNILVINAGSSSLKYQLIDMNGENVLAKGNCEKIGLAGSFLKHKANGTETKIEKQLTNHQDAIQLVLDSLVDKKIGVIESLSQIEAVGHRVVHGGEIYTQSVLIDDEVMKNLEDLLPLAPLHMPANIMGIRAMQKVLPSAKNVAVFDTAFHSQMPAKSFMYALPYECYTQDKVRRYGFHGTSHKFISNEVARLMNKNVNDLKIITVHLGNGSSMAAIQNGHSIDTTMGFTPLEGLMMGTRSGDVDPSVLEVLSKKYNLSTIGDAINFLNKKCGIVGINGFSPDMRENEEEIDKGNQRAILVHEMLAHRIKKYIGAYYALLGGCDVVVFAGGIGENDPPIRKLCLEGLECLGMELDVAKNDQIGRGTNELISTPTSRVAIYRIPTNEELLIARDTLELAK